MSKKQATKSLYNEAKKYIDMHELFPKSKYVGRNGLTDYQAKKIKSELNKIAAIAGGAHYLKKDFVPLKRTKAAKQFIVDSMLPKTAKGILLPGGEKTNKNVTIKNGAIFYNRGEASQAQFPLNATTEKTLEKSIRAHANYIANPENFSYLSTAGGAIKGVNILHDNGRWSRAPFPQSHGDGALENLLNLSLSLYLKYEAMARNGESRFDKVHGKRKAVHPRKWGLSLIVERQN